MEVDPGEEAGQANEQCSGAASDVVYARNAARPRPCARRALVELETLNSARLPVVSCFCVPARPSLVVFVGFGVCGSGVGV